MAVVAAGRRVCEYFDGHGIGGNDWAQGGMQEDHCLENNIFTDFGWMKIISSLPRIVMSQTSQPFGAGLTGPTEAIPAVLVPAKAPASSYPSVPSADKS